MSSLHQFEADVTGGEGWRLQGSVLQWGCAQREPQGGEKADFHLPQSPCAAHPSSPSHAPAGWDDGDAAPSAWGGAVCCPGAPHRVSPCWEGGKFDQKVSQTSETIGRRIFKYKI